MSSVFCAWETEVQRRNATCLQSKSESVTEEQSIVVVSSKQLTLSLQSHEGEMELDELQSTDIGKENSKPILVPQT